MCEIDKYLNEINFRRDKFSRYLAKFAKICSRKELDKARFAKICSRKKLDSTIRENMFTQIFFQKNALDIF